MQAINLKADFMVVKNCLEKKEINLFFIRN